MNWDHVVSWGGGILVGLAIPEVVVRQPELKKKQKMSVLLFVGLGDGSTKSPMCGK